MTIEERTILAIEGDVCPACGLRRIHRFVAGVGTHEQRFAAAVVERIACGCPPPLRALSAPPPPEKNSGA